MSTDKAKDILKSKGSFLSSMKMLLEKFNWPIQARPNVTFVIESLQTVDRENNGNWWYHYK
ncbi:hypothetical protein TUM4644_37610 [Shewanella colwelliana]|nr:hypothetical protein TUM4644_37610 [Shewanella colwelliana]